MNSAASAKYTLIPLINSCRESFLYSVYYIRGSDVLTAGMVEDGTAEVEASASQHDWVQGLPFVPGNIHDLKFRRFWEKELNASGWVMEVLKNGYDIPFMTPPGEYEEDNNASARTNMCVVRSIVASMILDGTVEVVTTKPRCVSPLGLISKVLPDGTFKHRLVFDASRWVNKFIMDQHVTLSHLQKALDITEKGDWQVVFDLKSAFYHVQIRPHQRQFLGAALVNTDGSRTYFVYKHLPFGLKCAVHAITKIWKPMVAMLQKSGIRMSIYIDDGRILAGSAAEAEDHRLRTYEALAQAGWCLEPTKSDGCMAAGQLKTYLGFNIDTNEMKVTAGPKKLADVELLGQEVLNNLEVCVFKLSKLLGKIVALQPSHGLITRVATRSGYLDLAGHVDSIGWKGQVRLGVPARRELQFFMDNIGIANGSLIQSEMASLRVESICAGALASKPLVNTFGTGIGFDRVVSDASSFKAAVIDLDSPARQVLEFPFSAAEKDMSSGFRELLAVERTLEHWRSLGTVADRKIYWITDSSNVVAFLSKGSSRTQIQAKVFNIVSILSELRSHIVPIHLYREDERIVEADLCSKTSDSDDWSIDWANFEILRKSHNLRTDAFADNVNTRLPRFFSKFYVPNTSGVDAFAQVWSAGMWMCPPVSLLMAIASEIRKRKCEGILVMPDWPTSVFYSCFFKNGTVRPPFCLVKRFKPFIYQNQNAKGPLKGKITFEMIALHFENKN